MIDDAHIRRMVLAAIPQLEPGRFEVSMMDYDVSCGYWYRSPDFNNLQGRALAIQRTEAEIAQEIAAEIAGKMAADKVVPITYSEMVDTGNMPHATRSSFEGRAGRHPNTCTCSKHLNGS